MFFDFWFCKLLIVRGLWVLKIRFLVGDVGSWEVLAFGRDFGRNGVRGWSF